MAAAAERKMGNAAAATEAAAVAVILSYRNFVALSPSLSLSLSLSLFLPFRTITSDSLAPPANCGGGENGGEHGADTPPRTSRPPSTKTGGKNKTAYRATHLLSNSSHRSLIVDQMAQPLVSFATVRKSHKLGRKRRSCCSSIGRGRATFVELRAMRFIPVVVDNSGPR